MPEKEEPKPLTDEEVLKAHAAAHKSVAKELTSRVVPEHRRDPKRLYLHNMAYIPEGYYDELTKEDLAGIENRSPDALESLETLVKEWKKEQGEKKDAEPTPTNSPAPTKEAAPAKAS